MDTHAGSLARPTKETALHAAGIKVGRGRGEGGGGGEKPTDLGTPLEYTARCLRVDVEKEGECLLYVFSSPQRKENEETKERGYLGCKHASERAQPLRVLRLLSRVGFS